MVLINNLTIDEINAALLHLQRARTEVVGGTKGSTVQNITVSNKGGGSTVDYAPTITALSNRVDKNTDDIESVEDEIDKIQTTLEQLSDNGISSMTFDPVTRQLQINTQDGEVYSCDITSENITLNFDTTTNKLTLEMGEQYQEVTLPYINANEKGSANGVATLDSSGRVPYSQLPESAMEFLGNWNASTNTPHLQDGTGTNGDFYVCNVGGTVTFGTGNTQTFVPNDRVIYNGTSSQWIKLPAGQVSSVNGMSGDVTLTASDINYSQGVTIKDKIDANAPVQADWVQTNSSSKGFIKNKIPIWITNGSADDNMSPVDVVQAGNTRPVTSNGVANAITDTKNGSVMENLDLNSYTECGLYVTKDNESYTNVPANMDSRYFSLLVVASAKYLPPLPDHQFRNQILYKYDANEIYTRTYYWGGQGLIWSEWRKVIFQDELGIKETEKRIGTWIDGSPLYEKAILFNVPRNGVYSVPINVTNLKNVVNWRGNFFQNGYQNPAFIMHIPYTYFDSNNLADMINIYIYYNPPASGFQCNFYGSGVYASAYFNGQGILYVQYTKNG